MSGKSYKILSLLPYENFSWQNFSWTKFFLIRYLIKTGTMMQHMIWNLWQFPSPEMFSSLESNQRCSVMIFVELQLQSMTTWIDICSANMMQHTKMRRLYLQEPSALIPTVTKNISIKANTPSTFQKTSHWFPNYWKKKLQNIYSSFFFMESKRRKWKLSIL